MLLVACKLQIK